VVLLRCQLRHEAGEVFTSKFPLKGTGHLLIMGLKADQPVANLLKAGEVIGGQDFPLDDREVDLNLVEPTRVNRRVDHHRVGPPTPKSIETGLASMGGPIVHDPEDPAGPTIGLARHHFFDQALEGRDSGFGLTATKHLRPVNIPGGEIGPSPFPLVLMLDPDRSTWSGRP